MHREFCVTIGKAVSGVSAPAPRLDVLPGSIERTYWPFGCFLNTDDVQPASSPDVSFRGFCQRVSDPLRAFLTSRRRCAVPQFAFSFGDAQFNPDALGDAVFRWSSASSLSVSFCHSVFKYIETFYNPRRIHQALAYLTPDQYEADHAPAAAA